MFSRISRVGLGGHSTVRGRVFLMMGALLLANALVWLWAIGVLHGQTVLLGTALLAYSFGLRHAVDADHIAAIDNVTRKLMQQGERPVTVGMFFSLGHSAVVIAMSAAVAFATSAMEGRFESFKAVGGVVSTIASATFLFLIAFMNIAVLISLYRSFNAVKRGEPFHEDDFDLLLNKRGLFNRIFRAVFNLITASWQCFFVGFLFGIGFDTATEIALFGLSATQAQQGVSVGTIMVFPALFTAGMSLIDSLDGVLMLGAYGWAFMKPMRKLFYNITITTVSVIVAIVIGGIEALGLIGDTFAMTGSFWESVGTLNENFGLLGYVIIGIFAVSWLTSVLIYKMRGYDAVEVQVASSNTR